MDKNWFTAYPSNIHDMAVTPKTKQVKIWLAKDDVGLELSFKRITMSELEEWLSKWAEIIWRRWLSLVLANAATPRSRVRQNAGLSK
jgi:hypothetical protein